ncbi:hypothetical protein DFH28DRAFT_1117961 [Melampsora americana]|nr:hypothetical protein DFH28DRAFT_1117961 [Melampsora americana]
MTTTIKTSSTIINPTNTQINSKKRRLSVESCSESEEEEFSKVVRVQPNNLSSSADPSVKFSCTLPPTCHQPPKHPHQYFSTSAQLEAHHRTHHTHICAHHEPQLIFPDERFLDLHFRECHDPLLRLAREQGQRTFACFEYSCNRLFHTPRTRRLHLIDTHHYPPTFNFALPNHGLTSLYHTHGDAISLLRPEWSPESKPILSSSSPKRPPNSKSSTPKKEVHIPMVIERPVVPDPTPLPVKPRPTSPPEPTSAISLVSGFDRLSLVPRQVQLARIASKSHGKANS